MVPEIRHLLSENRVLACAHRGASILEPENTLAAFREAVVQGADMVELDVHLSRDGSLMVIHDERLERTTSGTGTVAEHSREELRRLVIRPDHAIPTLGEVLDVLLGKVAVNVELKRGFQRYEALEHHLVRLLREREALDQVLVSSFDHRIVQEVKRLEPRLQCGVILYGLPARFPEVVRGVGADTLHLHWQFCDPEVVVRCQAEGIPVVAWTVETRETAFELARRGVSVLVANDLSILNPQEEWTNGR